MKAAQSSRQFFATLGGIGIGALSARCTMARAASRSAATFDSACSARAMAAAMRSWRRGGRRRGRDRQRALR